MFQDGFDYFFVELIGLKHCQFIDWDKNIRTDLNYIFTTEKEIARAEVIKEIIVVYSNEHPFIDSLGGEISFQIDSIQVYDEKMRSITYAQLQEAND